MQSELHVPTLPCARAAAAGLHNQTLPKLGHVSTLGIMEMSFFISVGRRSKMSASLFFLNCGFQRDQRARSWNCCSPIRLDRTASGAQRLQLLVLVLHKQVLLTCAKSKEILPLFTCTLQKVLETPRGRERGKAGHRSFRVPALEGAVGLFVSRPDCFPQRRSAPSLVAIATVMGDGRGVGLAMRNLFFFSRQKV